MKTDGLPGAVECCGGTHVDSAGQAYLHPQLPAPSCSSPQFSSASCAPVWDRRTPGTAFLLGSRLPSSCPFTALSLLATRLQCIYFLDLFFNKSKKSSRCGLMPFSSRAVQVVGRSPRRDDPRTGCQGRVRGRSLSLGDRRPTWKEGSSGELGSPWQCSGAFVPTNLGSLSYHLGPPLSSYVICKAGAKRPI